MKLLYDIQKVGNHWFATYHTYYKEKLGIKELIYNLCLFYKSGSFSIMRIQTNDTLILVDNNFASRKKAKIKVTKIMRKN